MKYIKFKNYSAPGQQPIVGFSDVSKDILRLFIGNDPEVGQKVEIEVIEMTEESFEALQLLEEWWNA